MSKVFLELKNVYKSFGEVLAHKDINLRIGENEIIGLVGENGTGKSTLLKIISGVHQMDSGSLILHGNEIRRWDTISARNEGIETVYQDKALSGQQSL